MVQENLNQSGLADFGFPGPLVYIILIFGQNIACGYTLEPSNCDCSKEYPYPFNMSKKIKIPHIFHLMPIK